MANAKKAKKPALSPEETKAQATLDAFNKQHEGKTLTDDQKKHRQALKDVVGRMRFVRIANKRVPKALAVLEGIGNLSGPGYVKTDAQVKAICDALDVAVKSTRSKLSGTKEAATGFVLPSTDGEKA